MLLIFPKPLNLQQLTRYNTVLPKGQRVCICLPLPLHLPLAFFMNLLLYPTVCHFSSKHRNEVKITDGKGSEIHPLLKSKTWGLAPAHSPKPALLASRADPGLPSLPPHLTCPSFFLQNHYARLSTLSSVYRSQGDLLTPGLSSHKLCVLSLQRTQGSTCCLALCGTDDEEQAWAGAAAVQCVSWGGMCVPALQGKNQS